MGCDCPDESENVLARNPLDDLSAHELAERAVERLEKEQAINRELREENQQLRAALAHIGGV